MAQRSHVVQVHVEEVARESGLWCTRCALPSGWRFFLAVWFGPRMHLQVRDYCDECESGKHVIADAD